MTIVRCNGAEQVLGSGETFEFGRVAGTGQLTADDRRVSGVHGVIGRTADGWTLTCLARFSGLTVYDCDSPSRLLLPPGAGPVTMPFARAIVAVEFKSDRYHLEADGLGAPGWSTGWRSSAAWVEPDEPDGSTVHPHFDIRFTDRAGRPLRWYQTLVALCEPRLQNPPNERIPSNRELAQRLRVSQSMVENHYLDRLRKELGFPKFDDQSRLAAVIIAISQAMVTSKSLIALDLPGLENDG